MTVFGTEVELIYFVGQIIGFFAMACGIVSYQLRLRSRIIILQTVSNVFWLLHYAFIGSYAGMAANIIGTVRNLIYCFSGRYKFADSKLVPAAAIIAVIVSGAFTYENPFDILPMLAMVAASIGFFIKKEKTIRFISLIVSLSWFTYSIYAGSISGALADGITFVSIIVALVRYSEIDFVSAKKRVTKNNEPEKGAEENTKDEDCARTQT